MDVDPVSRPLPPPLTEHQSDVVMAAPSHSTESSLSNPLATPTEPDDTANTHAFENVLVGLSNPRGTSISSSLLPIRPDSDDEDFYNREDQDFSRSGRQPSRGRPGPDLVADLIQHQFAQHESSTPYHPTTTPREPMQAVEPQQELNNSTASVERREPTEGPSAAQHRRRLRSSSLRGVMGFQPTGTTVGDDSMTTTTADNSERTEARPSVDRPQFILSQLPFLTRLLTDISRGLTPEGEGQNSDSPTGPDVATDSSSTQTDDEATPSRRRPNTTIRLIQIGGLSFGRPRETGGIETGGVETTTTGETTAETAITDSSTTGSTTTESSTGDITSGYTTTGLNTTGVDPSTAGNGGSGSEEDSAGEGARREEAMGEAFIMFLSSQNAEPESETESTTGVRPRAPWVVVSFSGACKFTFAPRMFVPMLLSTVLND